MSLGENIYKLRTDRRMSQEDFASAMEVSRQSVSKWENDMAVPELEKLIKMTKLFEVSLDELVGNTVPPKVEIKAEPSEPDITPEGNRPKEILCWILLFFGVILPPLILNQHHTPGIIAPMIPPIATVLSAYLAPKNTHLFRAYVVYHVVLSFFIVISPIGFGLALFYWGCIWFWHIKRK